MFEYKEMKFGRIKMTRKEKLYKLFFPRAYRIKMLENEIKEMKSFIGDKNLIQGGIYNMLYNEGTFETSLCKQILNLKTRVNDVKKNQDDFDNLLLDYLGLESKIINTTPKIVIRKKVKNK